MPTSFSYSNGPPRPHSHMDRRNFDMREDSLPILDISVPLRELTAAVDEMAREQQRVPGRHGRGVAHEGGAVDGQGGGHTAGDTIINRGKKFPLIHQLEFRYHLVFL